MYVPQLSKPVIHNPTEFKGFCDKTRSPYSYTSSAAEGGFGCTEASERRGVSHTGSSSAATCKYAGERITASMLNDASAGHGRTTITGFRRAFTRLRF
jgi:hypothetical protein